MQMVRSYSKEGGIDMSTIPDSWREVFEAAGVSRQDLLNPTTSKEVLKFVGDFLAGTEPHLLSQTRAHLHGTGVERTLACAAIGGKSHRSPTADASLSTSSGLQAR